jgi:signal peptidase I
VDTNENVMKSDKKKRKYTLPQRIFKESRDYLVILILFMLVYILCFRVVIVVGSSMFDTLVDGDYLVLISNVFYTEPKYGDIIVASKDSFRNGECIVKRVIATEGQEVDIDFENGIVYVDGEALQEDYIYSETKLYEGISFPLTVSDGCLFVLGDNRMDSKDSRSPEIGFVDRREILGKAIFLLLPGTNHGMSAQEFDRIGVIE